jgi:hypothetical protein
METRTQQEERALGGEMTEDETKQLTDRQLLKPKKSSKKGDRTK